MSYEGVPHIIDLGKSQAVAETEAQLIEQDCDPAVACIPVNCPTRSHVRPRPIHRDDFIGNEAVRAGLDSGGPAVLGPPGPVRPVTLRRHLSVALPLSKSRRT